MSSARLLQPLTAFFADPDISEVLINRPCEVLTEKHGKFTTHHVPLFTREMLSSLFGLLANENQLLLNAENPVMSGSLLDGSRVQLVIPECSKEYIMSIRRPSLIARTLPDYQKDNYYRLVEGVNVDIDNINQLDDKERHLLELYAAKNWGGFLKQAVLYHKNIVVAGGTGSGKTTFTNALLREIPLDERIIVLEDTYEIDIPHTNQVNLKAPRDKNQSTIKVDMSDLVKACMRLRPDRIIMGELRGAEVLDYVTVNSTGHEGSITTVHANSARLTFMRMVQLYKQNNVPSMTDDDILNELKEVVDIVFHIARTKAGRVGQGIYYKYAYLLEKEEAKTVLKSTPVDEVFDNQHLNSRVLTS